jgi:protein-S-isoprenylcysteine O-methyltransferase Ste14
MKAQYRITIGQTQEGSHQAPHGPRNKLELLKASLLTLLALSSVIGVFLAAFVLGSIIASVLLILVAISAIALVVRRFVLKFRRSQTTCAHD